MIKADFRLFLAMRIKILRERSGLSQEELAEKIGYSWRSISNIERGKCIPDFICLVKISHFFHVSLDSFIPPIVPSFFKISERRQNIENQFINLLREYDDWILVCIGRIFKEQMETLEKCGLIHKRKLEISCEMSNIRNDE